MNSVSASGTLLLMKLIYQELQRLAVDEEVPPDLLETLQMVALTLNGLKEECE